MMERVRRHAHDHPEKLGLLNLCSGFDGIYLCSYFAHVCLLDSAPLEYS